MVPSDESYLTEVTGKNATGSTKKRSWQSKIYCNNSRILNFFTRWKETSVKNVHVGLTNNIIKIWGRALDNRFTLRWVGRKAGQVKKVGGEQMSNWK